MGCAGGPAGRWRLEYGTPNLPKSHHPPNRCGPQKVPEAPLSESQERGEMFGQGRCQDQGFPSLASAPTPLGRCPKKETRGLEPDQTQTLPPLVWTAQTLPICSGLEASSQGAKPKAPSQTQTQTWHPSSLDKSTCFNRGPPDRLNFNKHKNFGARSAQTAHPPGLDRCPGKAQSPNRRVRRTNKKTGA